MSLIATVPPEQAEGVVAEVYAEIQGMIGFIPNAIRMDSINPAHMAAHWAWVKQSLGHPSLSQAFFATLRMLTSEIADCEYCVGLNAGFLMQNHDLSAAQIAAIKQDPTAAPLSPKERALLVLALDAARDSNAVTAAGVDAARTAGASDREIFDAVSHAAWQVAGDIVLNAFKVAPDLH